MSFVRHLFSGSRAEFSSYNFKEGKVLKWPGSGPKDFRITELLLLKFHLFSNSPGEMFKQ